LNVTVKQHTANAQKRKYLEVKSYGNDINYKPLRIKVLIVPHTENKQNVVVVFFYIAHAHSCSKFLMHDKSSATIDLEFVPKKKRNNE
jgi:hypothetical protein